MVWHISCQDLKTCLKTEPNISELCFIRTECPITIVEMWNTPDTRASLLNELQLSCSSNNTNNNDNSSKINYIKDSSIIPNSALFLSGLRELGDFIQEIYELRNANKSNQPKKHSWILFAGVDGSNTLPHYDGLQSFHFEFFL